MTGQLTGRIASIPPGRIEDIQPWLRRVAADERETSVFAGRREAREFKIPKAQRAGVTEVVGIPLQAPGLYVVEIESAILGKALLHPPKPMFVPTAVLVTNLAVHFKQGRESSLVWVTSLDKAEPVEGAQVSLMNCAGQVLWKGQTDADGVARIDTQLPSQADAPGCPFELPAHDYSQLGALRNLREGFFVTAQIPGDMSFVHSSWEEGIESWRFKLPAEPGTGPIRAHTIFDRSLLRAGETVHMKHLVRKPTLGGFALPSLEQLPDTVSVRHSGSSQTRRRSRSCATCWRWWRIARASKPARRISTWARDS